MALTRMARPALELRYNYSNVNSTFSSTETNFLPLQNIVQGNGHQDRSGVRIFVKSIVLKGYWTVGDTPGNQCRIVALRWREDIDTTVFPIFEVLSGIPVLEPIGNIDQGRPFRVLKDKLTIVGDTNSAQSWGYRGLRRVHMFVPVNKYVYYKVGGGAQPARKNTISFTFVSDSSTVSHPSFVGWFCIRFYDAA